MMMKEELKNLVRQGNYNCILLEDDRVIMTSLEKGVAPLYNYIKENTEFPTGKVEIIDKIVGRAVAFLAVYLNVSYINTKIISKTALDVLEENNIKVEYEEIVPYIFNRNKDGQCPMESALTDIKDSHEAFNIIDKFKKRQIKK